MARRTRGQRVLTAYADALERQGAKPNTIRNLRSAARRLGPLVRRGSKQELLLVRDQLLAEGLRNSTVMGYFNSMGAAWRWAWERGKVPTQWPRLRALRRQMTRKRPFTREEAAEVLAWFQEHRRWLYGLVLLLHDAGSRIGETLELRGADVDRERCTVRFLVTKSGQPRTVHVTRETIDALPEVPDGVRLWSGPKSGGALNHSTVRQAQLRCLRDLALPTAELDLHSFRRTVVHDQLSAGLPLPDSMRRVGHSDTRIHLRYAEGALRDAERDRQMADRLARHRDISAPRWRKGTA